IQCDGRKPTCRLCETHQRNCEYPALRASRRRKYWDTDYVKSLEDQIQLLSGQSIHPTSGIGSTSGPSNRPDPASAPPRSLPEPRRSEKALTDFTSLNWPVPGPSLDPLLFSGPTGYFTIPFRNPVPAFEPENAVHAKPKARSYSSLVDTTRNLTLKSKQHLKRIFIETINPFFQFVDPAWLAFSDVFPNNDLVLQLLYSAVFGAAAYYSIVTPHDLRDSLLEYAESIVLECCREHLCLPVIQSLLILSWVKHSTFETAAAYMYQYMAIGMSTHMRVNEGDWQQHTSGAITGDVVVGLEKRASLRTFWSLVVLDGYSTATVGAPSRLPWDLGSTPSYLTTMPKEDIDLPALAFEYHIRLTLWQREYLDPIYFANFTSLPQSDKYALFLKGYTALAALRKGIDSRLLLSRTSQPDKTQLVFWISYNTSEMLLHRRFLDPTGASAQHATAMRAVTAAANRTTRVLRTIQDLGAIHNLPPFAMYHVMRAAIVHLMNMTAEDERLRRAAVMRYRVCLDMLKKTVTTWQRFATVILDFLQMTSASWGLSMLGAEGADIDLVDDDSDEEST
ncbi:hypothetical protein GQ53DRAFT_643915, partial [Thozetella sp. PMI_491]